MYKLTASEMEQQALLAKIAQANQVTYESALSKYPDGSRVTRLETINSVENFLTSPQRVLLVTGDAGTGKSALYPLLAKRLLAKQSVKPVLWLYLDVSYIQDLDQLFIENALERQGFSKEQITKIKSQHQIICFIDNYGINGKFANIFVKQQLAEWQIKLIITCHKFLVADIANEAVYFAPSNAGKLDKNLLARVEMPYLSDEEWQAWVKDEKTIAVIQSHPILRQLVKNQLMLALFVEEFKRLSGANERVDIEKILVPTLLNKWFASHEKKYLEAGLVSQADNFGQRCWAYGYELSTEMTNQQVKSIAYRPTSGLFGKSSQWDKFFNNADRIQRLLRLASPLASPAKFQYQWLADGLINVFISLYQPPESHLPAPKQPAEKAQVDLASAAKKFDLGNLAYLNISLLTNDANMMQMLADRALREPSFRHTLFDIIEASKTDESLAIAAANAITALNFAKISLAGRNFSGVRIRGANLSGANLDHADFSNADLRDVNFQNSYRRGTNFNNAIVNDTEFGFYQISGIKLSSENFLTPEPSVKHVYHYGKKLLVLRSEPVIALWDMAQRKLVFTFEPKNIKKDVSLCLSENGKYLVISGARTNDFDDNFTVELWDIEAKKLLHSKNYTKTNQLARHDSPVVMDPKSQIVAIKEQNHDRNGFIKDSKLCLIDIKKFNLLRAIVLETAMDAIQFHPNGEVIMHALYNGEIMAGVTRYSEIKFIDVKTGQQVSSISIPQEKIAQFVCGKDGKYIIVISEKGKLQVWALQEPFAYKLLHSTLIAEDALEIQINANQTFFAVRYKNSIKLYQLPSAELTHEWRGHQGEIHCMAFNAGGYALASGGADHKVILWDLTKQQQKEIFAGHRSEVDTLFFLDDSDHLFSADKTYAHYIWRTQFIGASPLVMGHTAVITDVQYDPKSQMITSYGKDHIVCSWHATSGQLIRTLRLSKQATHQYQRLINHGKQYLQLSERAIEVWDTVTGNLLQRYPMPKPVVSMEVSKNSQLIAVVTNDGVSLLDINQNKFSALCHSFVLTELLYFCGQDKYLLTVFNEPGNQVKVWDIATQQCIRILTISTGQITAMAVNNQTTLIVLGDECGHLYLFDFHAGILLKSFQPAPNKVVALHFSPDDNYLYYETKGRFGESDVDVFKTISFSKLKSYTFSSDVNCAWSTDSGLYVTSGALHNSSGQGFRPVLCYWNVRENNSIREFSTSSSYSSKLFFITEDKLMVANDKGDVALWQYKMGAVRREWFLLWSSSTSLEVENSPIGNTHGLPALDLNLFAGESTKQRKAIWNDLHMACARGEEARVKTLLQAKSFSVNAIGEDNDTSLHLAIENGHNGIARLLIEQGANCNAKGRDGRTPLHVAAYYGRLDIIKQLLAIQSLDISLTDDNGDTALHVAIARGQQAIVETIFTFDMANKIREARDRRGITPLLMSVENGHAGMLRYLIAQGANLSAKTDHGYNLVHLVVICANLEILEIIFKLPVAKVLLKATASDGYTALHLAASCDDVEKLELLISQGAELEARTDQSLLTPLHVAALNGREQNVMLLVRRGANVKAVDAANKTPLESAIDKNYLLITEFLLAQKDYQPTSAEDAAKLFNAYLGNNQRRISMFSLLLEKQLDKKISDFQWHYLLKILIEKGMAEEIEMLLRSNQAYNSGRTIEQQRLVTPNDAFKLFNQESFLQFERDLNLKEKRRVEILLLLLDAGFDIDAVHPTFKHSFYHRVVTFTEYPLLEQILKEHKAKLEEADEQAMLEQAIALSLADNFSPVVPAPAVAKNIQVPDQSSVKAFLSDRESVLTRDRDIIGSAKSPSGDSALLKSVESKGVPKP